MSAPFSHTDQSEETVDLRYTAFGAPLPPTVVKPADLVHYSQMARRVAYAGPQEPSAEAALSALRKIAAFAGRPDYASTHTATLCIAIARDALRQTGELPVKAPAEECFRSSVG